MERQQPKPLDYSKRYGQMNAQHSIQDIYDVLVELLTNADDSYHRLHESGQSDTDRGPILIQVEPHRGSRSVLVVSDRAEGIREIERAVQSVGERTSAEGDRGFMARGLKDCAALGHVTVESIHNGELAKAEITPDFDFIPWKAKRKSGRRAKGVDRQRLGIPNNGTLVRIDLDQRVCVPRQQTQVKDLHWHFALRDIFSADGPGKVMLKYGSNKPVQITHVPPEGELVLDEEYKIRGYEGYRARFRLLRSQDPLPDSTDRRFRRSGILMKGARGIYECSFLKPELDNDPAAEHYFGWLDCPGIDKLAHEWDARRANGQPHPADNPLLILDPNRRDTIARNHPFTQALFKEPIEWLKLQFEKDRQEKKKSQESIEAKETTARLRKLAREASRFIKEKLEDLETVSPDDVVSDKTFVAKGIAVSPVFTQIPVGKQKRFYVKVHEDLGLPLGTEVSVKLGKAASRVLEVVGEPNDLEPDPIHESILRGSFILRGVKENERVQVGCVVDGLDAVFSEVEVLPAAPQDLEIPGDFSFHRKQYTVREGSRKKLLLRARFDPPVAAEPPGFNVRMSRASVAVIRSRGQFQLVPGTTYYEAPLVVEGRKLNATTKVIAEVNGKTAEASLKVVPKAEEGIDLKFELVDYSLGQRYRASWDRQEPNKLLISTLHESISRYLGPREQGYPGQHQPHFRVLLAELIADNVCRRIVEEHMKALPHEFDGSRLYGLHNQLMKEFTPIAHRIQLAKPDQSKAAE